MKSFNHLDPSHAFCVLAHADEEMFRRLTKRLLAVGPVYAHIDAKTDATNWHKNNPYVSFVEKSVDVFWGDWSMVEATIAIIRLALSNRQVRRITLVSGTHYLLVSPRVLAELGSTSGNIISATLAPNAQHGKPDVQYRVRFVRSRHPNTLQHRIISFFVSRVIRMGRHIKWERFVNPDLMRAGSSYWSVDRRVAEYFVKRYDDGGSIVDYFKQIVCPDEKFFHTVFAEIDPMEHSEGTTFSKWRGGQHPLPLTKEDIDEVIARDTFWFARKFDSLRDGQLLDWLDEHFESGHRNA